MNALCCGLDKRGCYAAIIDDSGNLVEERRLLSRAIRGFLSLHHPKRVAVKASTCIAPIYRVLMRDDYDILVSHPT